jgi:hypothetical protein
MTSQQTIYIPVPSAAEEAVEEMGDMEFSVADIQANSSGDGNVSTLTAGGGGSAGSTANAPTAPSTATVLC